MCAAIPSSNGGMFLVWRINKMSKNGTCWPETTWFDGLRNPSPNNWTVELGCDSKTMEWVHEDKAQLNNKGYSIRLFIIRLTTRPNIDVIFRIGQEICKSINRWGGTSSTLHIHRRTFMWLPVPAVWQAVIGAKAAYREMMAQLSSELPVDESFYDRNEGTIHTYFERFTLISKGNPSIYPWQGHAKLLMNSCTPILKNNLLRVVSGNNRRSFLTTLLKKHTSTEFKFFMSKSKRKDEN